MEMDEEKSVSLLDVLVVVAENLRLLILGPLVVGLLALGYAYTLPRSYISQAYLSLTPSVATQATSMMVSPIVLDPVIRSLDLSKGRSVELARAELISRIRLSASKEGLLRVELTANTPDDAQTLTSAVLESWLKSTLPGKQERVELEKRLAYASSSLSAVNRLLDRLSAESAANLNKPLTRGEAGLSIIAVGELQARYQTDVLSISRLLQGQSPDVVVQPPTLPVHPIAPKKGLIAVLATIVSGIGLLLWLFMRQMWQSAAKDSLMSEKQARLLALLGLKK